MHIRTAGGKAGTSQVYTGCNSSFSYQDETTSCENWASILLDSSAFVANPLATTGWISGPTQACNIELPIFCIRMPTELPLTNPPTFAPVSPTTAFPTPSPTALSAAPTAIPSTTAPSAAPTQSGTPPTTSAPTSLAPTATTSAPTSLAPTGPTNAPSRAPTTARPTSMIVITNFTGDGTQQNVTVPGHGADVTVILPSSLFLYGNSTASVIISKGNLGDSVSDELRGGDSVVSIDVIVDGEAVDVMGLGIPVEFVIPRPMGACEAQLEASAKCVWWDTTELLWRTDNCAATPVMIDGAPATRCACNHLTDFAVLLNGATSCTETSDEAYLVFAAIYATVTLYCFVVTVRLQMLGDRATLFLRTQHSAIGAVAVFRMLSCFRFYGLLGDDLVLQGVLTALPYLIEFWIFTRLASTWLGLVEFTMMVSDLRWEKIRPWLYGLNIVGSLFVIALFTAFFIELDYTTALVGTIGIASIYTILAFVFLYYSSRLVSTMSSGSTIKRGSSNSGTSLRTGLCSPSTKILLAGRVSALCFSVQAVSSVLALVLERELIAAFTMVFLAFNCLALIGLLMVYQGAVTKGLRPKVGVSSENSSHRSVELTKASVS